MNNILDIKNEISIWLDYVNSKRDTFRERLIKYVEQDKDEEKIWVNTVYALMQLGLAIRHTDETSVVVKPRKFWDEEYASNLTDLAAFDYDEMERKKLGYATNWDCQFFWVSLERNRGRNEYRQVIETSIEDPMTWITDPYSDFMTPARFNYFEVQILKSAMTEDQGFDEDLVAELTAWGITDIETNKTYRNEASGLNNVNDEWLEDFYVDCYDWFRYDNEWDLYLITVDSATNLILREQKIEPVTVEEKKTWKIDMRTQVAVTYYSPKRWDAFGINLVDLAVDKQKGQSILLNLRMADAKFSTFGQMNLVNTDIVKNTNDLLSPSTKTKWIWVNAWAWSLSNAVYPVPRQSIMSDSYNVSNELSSQLQLDTWMSENTLWVAEKGLTLWQSQQVQQNANLRLSLWISISNWGEEDFWKFMWFRTYNEYFDTEESKFIRVANGFDSMPVEFRRDDFIWIENPEIRIESKKKAEQDRQKENAAFQTSMPYFMQDPTIPKIIKTLALRYSMRLQWSPREMIKLLTYNKDEEWAKAKVIAINNKDDKGILIDNMSDDHQTYLVMFESAIDSPIKDRAIQARKQAYIMSGQMASQQGAALEWGWGNWMINSMQNQMTSNMLSQQNKWDVTSTWSIAENV